MLFVWPAYLLGGFALHASGYWPQWRIYRYASPRRLALAWTGPSAFVGQSAQVAASFFLELTSEFCGSAVAQVHIIDGPNASARQSTFTPDAHGFMNAISLISSERRQTSRLVVNQDFALTIISAELQSSLAGCIDISFPVKFPVALVANRLEKQRFCLAA